VLEVPDVVDTLVLELSVVVDTVVLEVPVDVDTVVLEVPVVVDTVVLEVLVVVAVKVLLMVDDSVDVVRPSQMSSHKTYASITLRLESVLKVESKK
jgi:hypothetical protein